MDFKCCESKIKIDKALNMLKNETKGIFIYLHGKFALIKFKKRHYHLLFDV